LRIFKQTPLQTTNGKFKKNSGFDVIPHKMSEIATFITDKGLKIPQFWEHFTALIFILEFKRL